jgi:signal transduction histidine kinase
MSAAPISTPAPSSRIQTEMHRRIDEFDWAKTSMGPRQVWPQSLSSTIKTLLGSRYPMVLLWGPKLIQIYNEAYIKLIGDKHPEALGRSIRETQAESWEVIGPMIHEVMSKGVPNWVPAQCLPLERSGYREESYFSLSYSPVDDDQGEITGMLCVCSEVTEQVLGERRLKLLRDLGIRAGETHSVESTCSSIASVLGDHSLDVPFAFLYLLDASGQTLLLESSVPAIAGASPLPARVALEDDSAIARPLLRALQGETLEFLLPSTDTPLLGGPWSDVARHALALPLRGSLQAPAFGVLVAGRSPNRALDENYASFYELLGNQLSLAIRNARAYEDERRRAESLLELDRAKSAFFSNVSHEFRTPLTLILGPLEDALRTATPTLAAPSVSLIHRNALRLLRLVNSLLDFSSIDAGRVQVCFEPTDLATFTADLASSFRSLMERAGLRLLVNCPPLSGPVHVDRVQWEKVVLNLLSNAFKFTLAGEIEVRLSEVGDHVELSVRDTGTGIPKSELPRIFERFHRVQGTQGRSFEGTGIGLALVAQAAEIHHGSVAVASEPGRGSEFTVSIPLGVAHLPSELCGPARALHLGGAERSAHVLEAAQWLLASPALASPAAVSLAARSPAAVSLAARSPIAASATPVATGEPRAGQPALADALPSSGGTRSRILLADDNPDLREYLRRLLGEHWSVEAVNDGAAALASAQHTPPDLVLSDVMMPRLDGHELLRELRKDPRTSTIPVILLSARAGEEAVVAGLETGADDYLVKPFSALELITRVRNQLELAAMRRQSIEAAERERGQVMLRLLADASAALSESLDYSTTLARITRLAVPVLADWCFIDVVHESGAIARVHVAHADPVDADRAHALQQFPAASSSNRDNPPTRALLEGQPVLLEDVTEEQLRASSHSDEQFALLRQLEIRSFMSVPLQARGRILGSLSLATSHSQRRYGAADLVLAEDLARRCSLAMDNARLYAQAQHAISARDEFLAVASHELRTPLTPLQLQLYMLERRARELARDERAGDWLASKLTVLRRQSLRLERLVNQLLNVTELTGERFQLATESLDLAELVRGVLREFEQSGELAQSGCSVELRIEQPLVGCWDREHLAQVVTYLLENALAFAPGKPVVIELQRRGDTARLSVSDQGRGIPVEHQARIFERFERSVPERYHGGLGLGLWLVRGMVEAMGGRIALESAPQRGATFSVELPLRQVKAAPLSATSAARR